MPVRPPHRGCGDAGGSVEPSAVLAGDASAAAAHAQVSATGKVAASPPGAPARIGPDPRAAAFFDVDNTVMRGASIFHLARGMYARRFLRTPDILRFAWQQTYFRLAGLEHADHLEHARTSALSFIRGHSVIELTRIAEDIFEDVMVTKIWPGTRAVAQLHLDQGERVWLVTAAPVEVARLIASRLGLTGALGTVAEQRDGVYTGQLVGELLHGPAKAEAVRALAEREDLDLQRCAAYSDSANDIPMLSLVGRPCAVNPDAQLREHARLAGWQVREFRTGRRAASLGVKTAARTGAMVGGMAAGVALRRRSSSPR